MSESPGTEESVEVSALDGTNSQLDSNNGSEDPNEQLSQSDELLDRGVEDLLDEGYSPPDYEPRTKIPTESEEAAGLSLDDLLAAEEPEVYELADREDSAEVEALELGDQRAGRLVDYGSDGFSDNEKALVADDSGFAGGAASAEEAAMHIFDPEGQED